MIRTMSDTHKINVFNVIFLKNLPFKKAAMQHFKEKQKGRCDQSSCESSIFGHCGGGFCCRGKREHFGSINRECFFGEVLNMTLHPQIICPLQNQNPVHYHSRRSCFYMLMLFLALRRAGFNIPFVERIPLINFVCVSQR